MISDVLYHFRLSELQQERLNPKFHRTSGETTCSRNNNDKE